MYRLGSHTLYTLGVPITLSYKEVRLFSTWIALQPPLHPHFDFLGVKKKKAEENAATKERSTNCLKIHVSS